MSNQIFVISNRNKNDLISSKENKTIEKKISLSFSYSETTA